MYFWTFSKLVINLHNREKKNDWGDLFDLNERVDPPNLSKFPLTAQEKLLVTTDFG